MRLAVSNRCWRRWPTWTTFLLAYDAAVNTLVLQIGAGDDQQGRGDFRVDRDDIIISNSMLRCLSCQGLWVPNNRCDPDPSPGWCQCPNGEQARCDIRRLVRQAIRTASGRGSKVPDRRGRRPDVERVSWHDETRSMVALQAKEGLPWKAVALRVGISDRALRDRRKRLQEFDAAQFD